jgi:hypothetical protein
MQRVMVLRRSALAALLLGAVLAGTAVGAGVQSFILHHAPSYEYVLLPTAASIPVGDVVSIDANGRVVRTDATQYNKPPIGVVVRESAAAGRIAVAIHGIVEVNRSEMDFQTFGPSPGNGAVARGFLIGIILALPSDGPVSVKLGPYPG